MKASTWTLVMGMMLASSIGWGQNWENSIVTDRPDLTESSATVGQYRFQFETSFLFERQTEGLDQNVWSMPTLLRFGLTDDFEIRLEGDWYTNLEIDEPGGTTEEGYSPFAVGFKYHLSDFGGSWNTPDSGILVNIGVPSGSSIFDSEDVTGDIKLLTEWELSDRWGLGTNVGIGLDYDENGDQFTYATATAAVGYGWTERLGSFWEIAYQGPE